MEYLKKIAKSILMIIIFSYIGFEFFLFGVSVYIKQLDGYKPIILKIIDNIFNITQRY